MRQLRPYKFSIIRLRFAQWMLPLSYVGAGGKYAFSALLTASYSIFDGFRGNLASPVL
jgi:hypothetical protein